MSLREKKLLIFFATAGFLVLNFLAIGFFKNKRVAVDRDRAEARMKLDAAENFQASSEQITDQMDWLAEHEPEPAANQDVQTKLQQFCEKEAKTVGLTIKTQKPLPSEATEGLYFHRAKFQFAVTGTEEALYRWFDRINIPEELRIASAILITPDAQDDTKIVCTTTIEQWFVPLPPST